MGRLVPAWQCQTGSYSVPEWVFVFDGTIGKDGWPNVKCVNYLTPVDPEEQARLAEMKPAWMDIYD